MKKLRKNPDKIPRKIMKKPEKMVGKTLIKYQEK